MPSPADVKPRLSHALCGADLRTIAEVAASGVASGALSAGGVLRLGLAGLAAVGRLPITLLESIGPGRGAATAPMKHPPVFILGHWRSGTTHLYNVLSKSGRFGYVSPIATGLPWDFVLLERFLGPLLRKSLPSGRYIDSIPVNPDSPQEDEIALANMQRLSFYHGLYLPKRIERELSEGLFFDGASPAQIARWQRCVRRFFNKLERTQPGPDGSGTTLLIKNPVYAARVKLLRETFPGAKFVHIQRDPYRVLPSMRNFYGVLFKQLGLGPATGVDIDEIVLGTYTRMMETLYRDTEGLPESECLHVRFEDFERAPLGTIGDIYSKLDLHGGDAGFKAARPAFERYLDSVKGYKKNRYAPDPDIARLVNDRWGAWVDRLGYERREPEAGSEVEPKSGTSAEPALT
ncbi:MAG: sulfotransferase [Planctomycetota bacterium]